MAQLRQSASERFLARGYDSDNSLGINYRSNPIAHKLGLRNRRPGRAERSNLMLLFIFSLLFLPIVALITIFSYHRIHGYQDLNKYNGHNEDVGSVLGFLSDRTGRLQLLDAQIERYNIFNFDSSSGLPGQDSKNGDRDDRGRDKIYNVDQLDISDDDDQSTERSRGQRFFDFTAPEEYSHEDDLDDDDDDLDNEDDRDRQLLSEEGYQDSLKNNDQSKMPNVRKEGLLDSVGIAEVKSDQYSQDGNLAEFRRHDEEDQFGAMQANDEGNGEKSENRRSQPSTLNIDKVVTRKPRVVSSQKPSKKRSKHVSSAKGRGIKKTSSAKKLDLRRPPIPRKHSGPSCEMKFLNSTAQLVEPSESPRFSKFSLQYTEVEERPEGQTQLEPRFAGHQTFEEREDSFYASDKKLNCGFVKGHEGSLGTGFDMEEDDARFMSSCHIAVSSCIFGNSDYLRSPSLEMITSLSRKRVCFVMFTDENTLQTLSLEGQIPDSRGFIGLWKIVVVKNLPYSDMRRVGKVPKFLAHRIFPHARYSIWLDSKLLLQRDPLMILEYFLWRQDYEYAISNHYDRHCVWEEVAQNKKLNKYDPTSIDKQFLFYQGDGLKRFNNSDPNNLLPSNVPEGSFIVREHTPMSNLFSCLWFNEVDRFTSRDQLSFAYVYHKLRKMNPGKPFRLNMFKDCERRSITRLFHHKSEEKLNVSSQGNRTNVVASGFG